MKQVLLDKRAKRELKRAPYVVRQFFKGLQKTLKKDGVLEPPTSKKISSKLFEGRFSKKEQWRMVYTYFDKETIIILSIFKKKTNKTPPRIMKLAEQRRKQYL
jgi:phage-related protein